MGDDRITEFSQKWHQQTPIIDTRNPSHLRVAQIETFHNENRDKPLPARSSQMIRACKEANGELHAVVRDTWKRSILQSAPETRDPHTPSQKMSPTE